ncbi:MAG: metallophosphoesterase, partial [Hyphomicrobiaceae bacterium]
MGAYAFGYEPRFRLDVTRYRITPDNWPRSLHIKLAVLADIHAGEPYMPAQRIAEIVDRTNTLGADAVLLLGDYGSAHRWLTRRVPPQEWAPVLAGLKAPLGVHAVLGNHDWWDDPTVRKLGHGPVASQIALEKVGIPVYENTVIRLEKDGQPFWIGGLGDQLALVSGWIGRKAIFQGKDDLPALLARVTDNAPLIMMAHEPDIFPEVPSRAALTISGHTHG